MSIELTDQQQRALDASEKAPPRLIDPRTNEAYILVPVSEYEAAREVLEEGRRGPFRTIALPSVGDSARVFIGSPRLAQPGRAADFTMEVVEESRDAGL